VNVFASDIGHRTVIKGRLGFPLGTVVTIRGQWERVEPAKDIPTMTSSLTFVAKEVNQTRLDEPLRFASDLMSPLIVGAFKDPPRHVGDIWEVRALEAGRFLGLPDAARRELAAGTQAAALPAHPRFGFCTEIKYLAPQVVRGENAVGSLKTVDLGLRTARLKNALLEWGVLEAVLIDLVSSSEARSLYSGRNGTIAFGTARPSTLVAASELIDREEPPSELSAVQVQRALEAAKNAAWTQHERDFVESFRPKDQRIVVLDERRADAPDEVRARRRVEIVRAHTPGFSQDKQVAVVRVLLPVRLHVEYVTYVLARQDSNWTVLARVGKAAPCRLRDVEPVD
jgi:hypothetical protein